MVFALRSVINARYWAILLRTFLNDYFASFPTQPQVILFQLSFHAYGPQLGCAVQSYLVQKLKRRTPALLLADVTITLTRALLVCTRSHLPKEDALNRIALRRGVSLPKTSSGADSRNAAESAHHLNDACILSFACDIGRQPVPPAAPIYRVWRT
jgi:hypothetical protein